MTVFNLNTIISSLVFLTCLLLAIYIFYNSKKNKIRVVFGAFVLVIAFWILTTYLVDVIKDYKTVLFLSKVVFIGPILMPVLLLHFSFIFPLDINKLSYKTYVYIYILPLVLLLLLPTKLFVQEVQIQAWGTNFIYGILQPIFSAYFVCFILAAFISSILKYKHLTNINKLQIKYVFVGVFISFIIAAGTNIILPIFNIQQFSYIGVQSIIIFISFSFYAVVKYRLMNIRLVLSRSILYGLLVATVAAFFALSVLVVGEMIGGNTRNSKIITYIFSSFIVVIFLDPVKRTWARATDNIFYKDKIDYQALLQETGNAVSREIDLFKLSRSVCLLLAKRLKIKQVSVFVPTNGQYDLLASSDDKQKNFSLSNFFVEYLKKNPEILIVEELLHNQSEYDSNSDIYRQIDGFIKDAEIISAEMVVPIFESGKLTAVFVFKAKYSGDLYDQNDINFLKVLIPQIATAIEKSKLYEEVEKFNLELKQKVEDRTKSLKEANLALEDRNRFLTTTQAVTTMVSRTLDLKKVNQMIADAIEDKLGYVGGILSFVDEEKNVMRVGAITANKSTIEAMSLLPKEPREYESKLEEGFNLGVQSVLTGKINFSDKMSDFFSPPVDKKII
ncbi:MAG: histidine kinase N-terminal 7TM domain-containing protein, partial [bacterium]|nr:histidine kinase N-terminal 7TM domain-containing protein [bacterium]